MKLSLLGFDTFRLFLGPDGRAPAPPTGDCQTYARPSALPLTMKRPQRDHLAFV